MLVENEREALRLENLKQEFPQMPPEIRSMIEQEVEKYTSSGDSHRSHKLVRRIPILMFAAALILGATAFAGINLYQLYVEKEGTYRLKTSANTVSDAASIRVHFNYIPEGMALDDNGFKMRYPGTPSGITVIHAPMSSDTSSESLLMTDDHVVFSEELEIGGHSAVYLNIQQSSDQEIRQKLYVMCPEVGNVLTVYAEANIPKEELLKVIENIELIATGEPETTYTWGDRIRDLLAFLLPEKESTVSQIQTLFTAEEMENMKTVGEPVVVPISADTPQKQNRVTYDITATVTDVQIADDLSLLEHPEYIPLWWSDIADENGKLLPSEISYIKSGDGVNTLDEVVKTETVEQKLVYLTVAYTNPGSETLQNICFRINLCGIAEKEGGYFMYSNRAELRSDVLCDYANATGAARFEMGYYDMHGGRKGVNYITELKPQETVVIHAGCIVNADELPYLFVDLNAVYGADYYQETAAQRYVDIRQ